VTTAQRIGIFAATIVVLILAFVLLRPSGDDGGSPGPSSSSSSATSTPAASAPATSTSTAATTTAQAPVKTVRVVNGQPQGGIKTLSFQKGDRVRLRVVSDVADEIHIHGYDVKKDVAKGGSVQFSFPATIEGRFEIELENAGTQIANLEVRPS
jgi:FtsP/CotA-like multicopper oxidase with cupredoxin domain